MIRGLLFDLDGVLVNTNPLHCQAWKELAQELAQEVPNYFHLSTYYSIEFQLHSVFFP